MPKFFSIGGMAPTGGEGGQGSGSRTPNRNWPTKEQLEQRHPEYYRGKTEMMTSPFADAGDRMRIHGDEAEVMRVDRNKDGTQDVILQRSVKGEAGVYKATVEPDANRKQVVTKIRRTNDY